MKYLLLLIVLIVLAAMIVSVFRRSKINSEAAPGSDPEVTPPVLPTPSLGGLPPIIDAAAMSPETEPTPAQPPARPPAQPARANAAEWSADELSPAPEAEHRVPEPPRSAPDVDGESTAQAQPDWRPELGTQGRPPSSTDPDEASAD